MAPLLLRLPLRQLHQVEDMAGAQLRLLQQLLQHHQVTSDIHLRSVPSITSASFA